MRLLLAAALAAVIAVPAAARDPAGTGFANAADAPAVRVHRDGDVGRDFRRDDRDDRRRDRRRGDGALIIYSHSGGVSDRAWAPDSFNDWWHDRPARAYPAWMARNRNCEREYWSGGGWRC